METGDIHDEGIQAVPNNWRLARWAAKIADRAANAEARFLGMLRYAALVFAAVVLIGSTIYLGIGMFQQLGQTKVDAKAVTLAAEDIAPPAAEAAGQNAAAQTASVTPRKVGISAVIRKQTLDVYRSRFKPYQRADTKITDQQIVDFVWTEDRITAFDQLSGLLHDKDGKPFGNREAVMRDALGLVEAAAESGGFRKGLVGFRDAKMANVCTDEPRTRSRTFTEWDSNSMSCPNWYETPIGCSATRVVEEPYVEKVCVMKFPEGLGPPAVQFAAAVQRYADTAGAKLTLAHNNAEAQTAQNQARKVEGVENIGTSGKLFLGFLSVMFLYLFVAMERHHRSLRALIKQGE